MPKPVVIDVSRDFAECTHDEPCLYDHPPYFTCGRCYGCLPEDCHCWDKALEVARAILDGAR